MTSFTVDVSAAVKCSKCGRLWNLDGLRVITADAHMSVVAEVEGPCPGCCPPDDGGSEQDGDVVAAE